MRKFETSILSDHFESLLEGQNIICSVFLTYCFEPGFFEREILPVFIPVGSNADIVRLLQLEDQIKKIPGGIAVYYDATGLRADERGGSAKLDIRRIPVNYETGIFHPKNVFILCESKEKNRYDCLDRKLIVTSMSANLTRAGWWENVECCHTEEIAEGDKNALRWALMSFLTKLTKISNSESDHAEVRQIHSFLQKSSNQTLQSTSKGVLKPHFWSGTEPLSDFFRSCLGDDIQNGYLEIISPYFDTTGNFKPLKDLTDYLNPAEIRVYLPRGSAEEALCSENIYSGISAFGKTSWGRITDKEFLSLGNALTAKKRFVHAKVYRVFKQNPKVEIIFMGSPNLTSAAHSKGGNLESGFLIELSPEKRPDWWLDTDTKQPPRFEAREETEGDDKGTGTALALRYNWNTDILSACWNGKERSPLLMLECRKISIGRIDLLRPGTWVDLDTLIAGKLKEELLSSSIVSVHEPDKPDAYILVQEEGMAKKPSLILNLSVEDILRYWSMLTTEQRAAFLEIKSAEFITSSEGAEFIARLQEQKGNETFFDRFAGYFHSFSCLEESIRKSFAKNNTKEAMHSLFGKKYDSLSSLLEKVKTKDDLIDRYVILLSARQLLDVLQKEKDEAAMSFFRENRKNTMELEENLKAADELRSELIKNGDKDMAKFLNWFEGWFLKRAKPLQVGK